MVVDRKGPGNNLEEVWLADDAVFGLDPLGALMHLAA